MKTMILILSLLASFNSFGKDSRIRINVLDNGLTPMGMIKFGKFICKDGNSKNMIDRNGKHGTNVVSLIVKGLDSNKYCLEIHNILGKGSTMNTEAFALIDSFDAKYINLSFAGEGSYKAERRLLKQLIDKKIHIFVAAGNNNRNIDKNPVYPAGYAFKSKYYHVVGSSTKAPNGKPFSNFGNIVTTWEKGTNIGWPKMTGTSQATPSALNKFLKK